MTANPTRFRKVAPEQVIQAVTGTTCSRCGVVFKQPVHPHGGGPPRKFCTIYCQQRAWYIKNMEKVKEKSNTSAIPTRDLPPEKREKKRLTQKTRRLKGMGWTVEQRDNELLRQNYSCYGCLKTIDKNTARLDHDHKTGENRGLLCDNCNWALGTVRDTPATLRRLMAYLDHDRKKTNIYLAGSLSNTRIPEIGNRLRHEGYDVMDEWYTPGPQADENLQAYEKLRGRTYAEALRGRAATNIFLFDKVYLDLSDVVIICAPYGKSAMLELGYAKGRGKKVYIFFDGKEPERYDIMPGLVDWFLLSEEDLVTFLKEEHEPRKFYE